MNPDLIKQYLLTAVRWALAMFATKVIAWVAGAAGMPVAETTQAIAGIIVGGLMFVWALANKSRAEVKINTALDLSKGSSKDNLKAVIAAGQGSSATEAK